MDLSDGVAVVTGGASGIGRACALAFAEQGADVVVADIDEDGGEEVAAEVEGAGRKALALKADVSRRGDVERLVRESISWQGHCDLFMSNAGVGVGGSPERIPLEDWEWVVGINLWPHVWATRLVLPHMLERGRGHLVHTASAAGVIGVPSLAPYAMTKFAVVGLAESLAVYCSGRGVGVSVVCPMVVATNITEGSRMTPDAELDPETERMIRERQREMMDSSGIPPSDVATAVLDAVREERLYCFPHPELKGILDAKWEDPDAWVRSTADVWRAQREAFEQLLQGAGDG